MAKYLFTVETGDRTPVERDNDLVAMHQALREEFPAFYFYATVAADRAAAVVVVNLDSVPDTAWEKLNGWGAAGLKLELVR